MTNYQDASALSDAYEKKVLGMGTYDEAEAAYRDAFTKLVKTRNRKLFVDDAVLRRQIAIKQEAARQGSNADARKALYEQACDADKDLEASIEAQRALTVDVGMAEGEDRIARKRMDWIIANASG